MKQHDFSPIWVGMWMGVAPALAYAGCEPPQLVAPPQFTRQATAKPTIVWAPVANARQYDVTIESRVPEGEIIQRTSTTVVEPRYAASAPLAGERAIVNVSVRAKCANEEASPAAERVFIIDLRSDCPAPTGVVTRRAGNLLRAEWQPGARIQRVEARVFHGATATAMQAEHSTGNFVLLDVPPNKPWVAGLRSHCRESVGAWTWLD